MESELSAGLDSKPGNEMPSADDEGKYVYCVIKSPEEREFGPIGIGETGNPVYTVRYQDLRS